MLVHLTEEDRVGGQLPLGYYESDAKCGAQEWLNSDHGCLCDREFGHGKGHHCSHCGLWWMPGDSLQIHYEAPGSLNRRRLAAIEPRSREKPWFRDEHLVELTRRADLFVDTDEVAAKMQVAMNAGQRLYLAYMALEDNDTGDDQPVQRELDGVAVMDVIDAYPLGWAYISHPMFDHVIAISLDVVTDIGIRIR